MLHILLQACIYTYIYIYIYLFIYLFIYLYLLYHSYNIVSSYYIMGARIRETLGDIDPLNKAPFKRATSMVKKGSPLRVPRILPGILSYISARAGPGPCLPPSLRQNEPPC